MSNRTSRVLPQLALLSDSLEGVEAAEKTLKSREVIIKPRSAPQAVPVHDCTKKGITRKKNPSSRRGGNPSSLGAMAIHT